jgi:hypothetical protein
MGRKEEVKGGNTEKERKEEVAKAMRKGRGNGMEQSGRAS